jgi:hypothetical protein
MAIAIYCPPSKASKNVITVNATLTRKEVEVIRNYYEEKEDWVNVIATTLVTVLLMSTNNLFAFLGGITSTLLTSVISENLINKDNNIDAILVNLTRDTFNVICTYKYVRHGSNDGAYFLIYINFQ